MLNYGSKSVIIRGNDNYTKIPEDVLDLVKKENGTFAAHTHPYIGDIIPSREDKLFLAEHFPDQKTSILIDPTQKAVKYDKFGNTEDVFLERSADDW